MAGTHRPLITGTFVDSLLSQWVEFELMENFVALLLLLIFKVLAIIKPSQIDYFFLTAWWTCRLRHICNGFQRVYMGNPMLHIVNAEPRVVSDWAVATQIASNTHIICSLRDVLSEDVFIRRDRRSAFHTHWSARSEPYWWALIFELRVKKLKRSVCVVSLSLKASICQKGKYLELLTNNELVIVEIESVVISYFISFRLKEGTFDSDMLL